MLKDVIDDKELSDDNDEIFSRLPDGNDGNDKELSDDNDEVISC